MGNANERKNLTKLAEHNGNSNISIRLWNVPKAKLAHWKSIANMREICFCPKYRNKARYTVNMPATPTCKSENHYIDMVKYFHIPQKKQSNKQTNMKEFRNLPSHTNTLRHTRTWTNTYTRASIWQTHINPTHYGVCRETHKYVP